MDILLTHGYFLNDDPHELKVMKPYPPLGILYIAAYLKKRGYGVSVFDSTFLGFPEFEAFLAATRPPVVGIYCNLMTKFTALKMIAASKAFGAIVILGGPEPSNYVEEYLDRGADAIVFGEGEAALDELLPALTKAGPHCLEKVSGIAYRRTDGGIERTPSRPLITDLDSLPEPDRGMIEFELYPETWRKFHGFRSASLICARGCPYQCTWCSHSVYGHTHRRRSPRFVAQEVQNLLDRYKPDQLWYADDVFTIHHPWLAQYADELKHRAIRIPFECISRADRLNEEVIGLLADMGCRTLWIGSESGSQGVLDSMKRGVKVDQVQSMARALQNRGIKVGMFIMLGYEGEGIRDIEATADHLKRSAPDVFLTTVAYPIKGTEYYQGVSDRIISCNDWENWSDRDLGIRGRRSRRFYSFATRWLVNSVALERIKTGRFDIPKIAKAAANAAIGKIGMMWTQNEVEEASI